MRPWPTTRTSRNRRRLTATVTDLAVRRQRALLVTLAADGRSATEAEVSLAELERLVDTAGSDAVAREIQIRSRPDPATFIGKGKAADLAALGHQLDVDVVVVDGELTPVQQRNLQQIFGCDVVDRVAVILDIFAQHATSREGMAQVELALHRYRLPRLRGRGITMSQQAGGLGGARRGPGETKLEVDRRKVQERISILEDQIDALRVDRATRRKARRRSGLPTAALVGYTNSGKSSLLNRLTGSDVWWRTACSPPSTPPCAASSCPPGACCCCRTPSASCAACPTNWSRPSAPPWRKRWRPTCWCTSSTPPPPTPTARSRRCTPPWPRWAARGTRRSWWSTRWMPPRRRWWPACWPCTPRRWPCRR